MARAGWSRRARSRPRRSPAAPNICAHARRQAAGRPLSQHLCRRSRPRARRALVGAGRSHPGAVGRGLCAGEPAGAVARLRLALQGDERRAAGAVLRGLPRRLARQRRPRRAAHLPADAGPLQRNLFRTGPLWRAISASCWSRATISLSAATASMSAPSPA